MQCVKSAGFYMINSELLRPLRIVIKSFLVSGREKLYNSTQTQRHMSGVTTKPGFDFRDFPDYKLSSLYLDIF